MECTHLFTLAVISIVKKTEIFSLTEIEQRVSSHDDDF